MKTIKISGSKKPINCYAINELGIKEATFAKSQFGKKKNYEDFYFQKNGKLFCRR